ncbi:hypothetical protein [Motilibacter aurantiacus]|nr:hypothetical protein [Motilibacter aurantiacus]
MSAVGELPRRTAEQERHAGEHVHVPGRVRVGSPGDGEPGEDD